MVAGLWHFVFSSFRGEKTPRQKTKKRHAKNEKTRREKAMCMEAYRDPPNN